MLVIYFILTFNVCIEIPNSAKACIPITVQHLGRGLVTENLMAQ